jgi:hypothetical protein
MSAMMHKVKKSFHKATAPREDVVPSAAFLEYQQKLDAVKRNITMLDVTMTETNNAMTRQMIEQRSFSEKFADGYPMTLDETHAVAVEFKQGIGEVYDYFVRHTSPEVASYHRMQGQVKAYLKEIAEVEDMYPALSEARSETSRYQKKVDDIHMSNKRNDVKKTRNIHKLDVQREKLEQQTNVVLAAQKRTFAKAPMVHKLGLCAFWVAYRTHMQVMARSLEKTETFTVAHEEEMRNLDVASLHVDNSDEEPEVHTKLARPSQSEIAALTEGVKPVVPGASTTPQHLTPDQVNPAYAKETASGTTPNTVHSRRTPGAVVAESSPPEGSPSTNIRSTPAMTEDVKATEHTAPDRTGDEAPMSKITVEEVQHRKTKSGSKFSRVRLATLVGK